MDVRRHVLPNQFNVALQTIAAEGATGRSAAELTARTLRPTLAALRLHRSAVPLGGYQDLVIQFWACLNIMLFEITYPSSKPLKWDGRQWLEMEPGRW